jgi:hypothetical protein
MAQGIPDWGGGDTSWTTTVTVKNGHGYVGIPIGFTWTVVSAAVNLPAGASFSAPVFAGVRNGCLLFQPPDAGCPDGIYDITVTTD